VTTSPTNSASLQLAVLTTVFNLLAADDSVRLNVFRVILGVTQRSGSFELLKPQLASLPAWLEDWGADDSDARSLYLAVSEVANEAGEPQTGYLFLLKALQTFPAEESSSDEALDLATKILQLAFASKTHLDFSDLINLDAIQALRKRDPDAIDLLDVFATGDLEDYTDFVDEHAAFLTSSGLPAEELKRKMRLLTLASLAASAPQRALPYSTIAEKLQVPAEDVEKWAIDTIRAGLVEGKLSQLSQTFLVHRATHRVFGNRQWQEVAGRLAGWRQSLEGVLDVIRKEREAMRAQQEREAREALDGESHSGQGRDRQNRGPRQQQRERAVDVGGD
jgi:translation initiation factor 3 subunit M